MQNTIAELQMQLDERDAIIKDLMQEKRVVQEQNKVFMSENVNSEHILLWGPFACIYASRHTSADVQYMRFYILGILMKNTTICAQLSQGFAHIDFKIILHVCYIYVSWHN